MGGEVPTTFSEHLSRIIVKYNLQNGVLCHCMCDNNGAVWYSGCQDGEGGWGGFFVWPPAAILIDNEFFFFFLPLVQDFIWIGMSVEFYLLYSHDISILQLLNYEPEKRLGSGPGGAQKIKSHPFFSVIQWNKLVWAATGSSQYQDACHCDVMSFPKAHGHKFPITVMSPVHMNNKWSHSASVCVLYPPPVLSEKRILPDQSGGACVGWLRTFAQLHIRLLPSIIESPQQPMSYSISSGWCRALRRKE